MASARIITSSASPDSDLKRRSSSSSSTKSPSVSDLPNSIDNYDNDTTLTLSITGTFENTTVSSGSRDVRRSSKARRKTVDEVWGAIVAERREKRACKAEERECKAEPSDVNELMTLEDFLAKADAVENDGVKMERMYSDGGIFGYDTGMIMSERSGVEESGKRRALLEPLDKVAQQRQRRMIKNRESAARSRERKQAYQVELESMVVKLEDENELLLKEKEEQTKERFRQLMEKIIPVVEKRKPQRSLQRVCSAQW